jgi:hypothetical protein
MDPLTPLRTLLLTSLLPSSLGLAAQCSFTPTIDPPDLMMCPLTTDTLSTEEYDSYQWFKDGEPIPGATQRQLVVDYYSSVTFDFHVQVSLDGCIAQSSPTHVDGWAFLSPTVYTSGAVPYEVDNNGTALYCEGDAVLLTLGLPYTENITWFKDGEPINMASSSTLTVTSTGSYYVQAAPGLCPDLITGLGLELDLIFTPAVQPTIAPTILGALCASPANAQYEWSLNGTVIPGATAACLEPTEAGAYTARIVPGTACDLPSEPYLHLVTGLADAPGEQPMTVTLDASAEHLTVQWSGKLGPDAAWRILDAQGRVLRDGSLPMEGPVYLDTGGLSNGVLLFQALRNGTAIAPAKRFVVGR